jgi:septal ring factor EnvC (AmiA/AmiB activator)
MKSFSHFLFLLVLVVFCAQDVLAQTNYEEQIRQIRNQSAQTRSSIDALRSQITDLQSQITTTNSREETLFREYQKLEREIAIQNRLLRQLQNQGRQIENEIRITQASYQQLEEDQSRLVESYQKSLTHLYKYGRTNEMALIMTSGSLNQMLVRAYYLRKFDEQRVKQSQQIKEGQERLKEKSVELAQSRERTRLNAEEQRVENEILNESKRRQEVTLNELRTNRRFLQRRLDESRKQATDLENALRSAQAEIDRIARLQREEAQRLERLARARENPNVAEREEEVARYSVPIYTGEMLSEAEMINIGESFRNSRGRLAWPVERGEVITKFGPVRNPLYGTMTDNLGVSIAAEPGSMVRAVHKGMVTSIVPLGSFGDVVMVNHGTHMTAYGNLSRIMVQTGTIVNEGDIIGLSGRSESLMGAVVFFMVRDLNGPRNIDPELWLLQR